MTEQRWDSAEEFRVIAPSTKTTRTLLIVLAFLTAVGGLITFTFFANGVRTTRAIQFLGTGLVMLAAGFLFVMILWLWSANARLLIGRSAVGYRSIFRRSRFWSQGEIAHIVDMAIDHGWTSRPQRGFYFLGLDGTQLFVLTPRAWHANDLKDFIEATGVHVDYREAPVKAKAVRREFPKAFGWGAEHVVLATSITMVAAVGLVVAGYVVVSAWLH